MLFVAGQLLSWNAVHSIGLVGVVGLAVYHRGLCLGSERCIQLWVAALAILLLAGVWGEWVAETPVTNWRSFWSYQSLGKGAVFALAVLCLPVSRRSMVGFLAMIPLLLLIRNAAMLAHGVQHSLWVIDGAMRDQDMFLMYRNQGDHILALYPFLLAWVLAYRRHVGWLALLTLVEVGLLASTGWRGAWLGFAGACLMLFVLYRQWLVLAAFFFLLLAVGGGALIWSDSNIVAQALLRGFSDSYRVEWVWKPVLDILGSNGWRGFGFGQERYLQLIRAYSEAHPERAIPVFGDAHNMFLNFSVAAGWFGGVAYLALLLSGISLPLARARELSKDDPRRVVLFGLAAAWLGTFGLLGLTDQPHYHLFAILMAVTSLALKALHESPLCPNAISS